MNDIARRDLLKGAGMFVVSFAAPRAIAQSTTYSDPDFHQVDSWIVIRPDNFVTFYVGKTDCGQGTGTSFRQIMSDELDVAFENTACVMGSTDITVDQGGSGGSTAMERDSWPMRRVAAEARRALLQMASDKLGAPVISSRCATVSSVLTKSASRTEN
jgi:CO/xanthine dehydrogenase Mo-binding subunit